MNYTIETFKGIKQVTQCDNFKFIEQYSESCIPIKHQIIGDHNKCLGCYGYDFCSYEVYLRKKVLPHIPKFIKILFVAILILFVLGILAGKL